LQPGVAFGIVISATSRPDILFLHFSTFVLFFIFHSFVGFTLSVSQGELFCPGGFTFPCCTDCTRLHLRCGLKTFGRSKREYTGVEGKSYIEGQRQRKELKHEVKFYIEEWKWVAMETNQTYTLG